MDIYRIARQLDMDKYREAKAREHDTMIESREIAKGLGLQMKIGDVEYQGDGNKAIFYYIADERVDFRQLIKDLAAAFHVRIEMKQIGARQEAGRIGGTGPCGRELCCATWMKNFVSVSTGAARYQDISVNPQKLFADTLVAMGENLEDYKDQIKAAARHSESGQGMLIDRYSRDLTALAAEGKLDPVIGRDVEITRMIQTLSRRTKNNPCLT